MGQHGGGVPGGGAERMITIQELIVGVMRALGKADAARTWLDLFHTDAAKAGEAFDNDRVLLSTAEDREN